MQENNLHVAGKEKLPEGNNPWLLFFRKVRQLAILLDAQQEANENVTGAGERLPE